MEKATVWTNGNGATARRAAWLSLATAAAMVMTALLTGAAAAREDEGADRREVARGHMDLRQDRGDVRQFQRLLANLDQAQRMRDWDDERWTRRQIHQVIRREIEEGRRDVNADRRERGSEPSWQGRWDDNKDFRDSRRRFERQRVIAGELRRIQDEIARGSRRARAREDALLREFLTLMRQDARASQWELREDRRDYQDRHGDGRRGRD